MDWARTRCSEHISRVPSDASLPAELYYEEDYEEDVAWPNFSEGKTTSFHFQAMDCPMGLLFFVTFVLINDSIKTIISKSNLCFLFC